MSVAVNTEPQERFENLPVSHASSLSVSTKSFSPWTDNRGQELPAVNRVLLCGCLCFKGDINKKQKNIWKLERQIKTIRLDYYKVKIIGQKKDITGLEEDIQKITTNIQVGPEPVPSQRTPCSHWAKIPHEPVNFCGESQSEWLNSFLVRCQGDQ